MTKRNDEIELMDELMKRTDSGASSDMLEIIEDMGMNLKRAAYICEKWNRQGIYEYGINVMHGWLITQHID